VGTPVPAPAVTPVHLASRRRRLASRLPPADLIPTRGLPAGYANRPSAVVDILRPSASGVWEVAASATLSEARGWPATCSFGNGQDTVAFLGGAGARSGSRTLDLLSVSTGKVRSNGNALPWRSGRWGTSCIAAADGSQLVFGGGKIYPHMTGEVLVLPAGK